MSGDDRCPIKHFKGVLSNTKSIVLHVNVLDTILHCGWYHAFVYLIGALIPSYFYVKFSSGAHNLAQTGNVFKI